jgi:hypothetical protein
MSYNKGIGQFGKGNMWAMIRQLLSAQGSINASAQQGAGALQVAKGTYDFAVDGGAVGTIQLVSSPIIPANSIILGGILDPITTFNGGGGATVAVGIGTGASTAALKAAAGFATYVGGTPLVMLPVWSAAFFKLAADGKLSVTVAVAALTAGKMAIDIVYVPAGE